MLRNKNYHHGRKMGYRIEEFSNLVIPKSQAKLCELTGLTANVRLVTPHVTLYYATKEHAQDAWEGVISKVDEILQPLYASEKIIGNEEDRQRRHDVVTTSKSHLISICNREAKNNMAIGKPHLAIPCGIMALKFAKDIYGDSSIELVPCYLVLAEANLGLGKFKMAEEFLVFANWSVLKNPDTDYKTKSNLHRNFGKLYLAQGRFDEGLKELAKDIYFCSWNNGPEHLEVATAYFYMGSIFFATQKIENCLAMYDKVVDIWYKFLVSKESLVVYAELESLFNEGLEILKKIHNKRGKLLGHEHIATGEAEYTIGLLQLFMSDKASSEKSLERALKVYEENAGYDHPSTKDVRAVLTELKKELNEGTLEDPDCINNLYDKFPNINTSQGVGRHDEVQSPIPFPPSSSNTYATTANSQSNLTSGFVAGGV